jgi:hypothetical protein
MNIFIEMLIVSQLSKKLYRELDICTTLFKFRSDTVAMFN